MIIQQIFFSVKGQIHMFYRLCEQRGSVQLSSVAQSHPTLCDPMDCSTLGFPVHHQLLKLAQTHVHPVSDLNPVSHPTILSSVIPFSSCLQFFPSPLLSDGSADKESVASVVSSELRVDENTF